MIDVTTLAAWVLSLMVSLQPRAPWSDSYLETAIAIADVVEASPPLFDGADGRIKTAALLVSVAWFESRFRVDAVGDHGSAHGLYQQHDRGDLTDPHNATRVAIEQLRISLRACRSHPLDDRLAFYASGGADGCEREAGQRASRHRMSLARRLVARAPPSM